MRPKPTRQETLPELEERRAPRPKLLIAISVALAFCIVGAFSLYTIGRERIFALKKDVSVLEGAVGRIAKTQQPFLPFGGDAGSSAAQSPSFIEGFSQFWGALKGVPSDTKTVSESALQLIDELDKLSSSLPDFIAGKSDALTTHLGEMQATLASLSAAGERLSKSGGSFASFAGMSSDSYLPFLVDANRAKKFLDAFVPWLTSETPHHLAMFFYNPAELRPGGGFLGSYAEVSVMKGKVDAIEVHDINDADRTMREKIVPPRELQGIATQWRAADANWFFDFPASAEKTLELMEKSDYYRTRGVRFDGAVAVSGYAVSGLLALTGPVNVSSSKTQLTNENVLTQIQDEVQKAQQSKAAQPKKILEELVPALLARLQGFSPEERQVFLGAVGGWLQKKGAVVFFRDPALESFFDHYNFAGAVSPLPTSFNGSYLAVTDANPGSGKSDLYMHRTLQLQALIGADGVVTHHLTVVREHRAPKNVPSWYRLTNESLVKVFTNTNARLTGTVGGRTKTIAPRVNYATAGYAVDADLAAVEKTEAPHALFPTAIAGEESGKETFATWMKTLRGASSTVRFDYTTHLSAPVAEGMHYQFIFEKQMGAKEDYQFEVSAPVGFRFKENKLPVFEYTSSDPPGRVVLNLTLELAQ